MIFNSVTYLLFLLIVTILYWSFNIKARLYLVFFASLLFYAFWKIEFVSLMLISAINDYWMSILITETDSIKKKKMFLSISLFVNLGLLFVFKYLFFFTDNIQSIVELTGFDINIPLFNLILPLGISFYTFQTISYTVDVYRGFIKPQKDFITYGCYVMFFPQLVAGPILRAGEVIHQFLEKKQFQSNYIVYGIERILYGLFLKTVLADNIAPFVDRGFMTSASYLSALDVWTLAFLFGFQIYFDFSAYSHIAIGSAKLMGINFPENFNFPYSATSFKEFWKRWHISLSSWIRDYLYLPLKGAKVEDRSTGGLQIEKNKKIGKNNSALFITWAIMGLWHGANWTFVVWGLYHSILIYLERFFNGWNKFLFNSHRKFIGLIITLPLVMLGWIPFRAKNVDETIKMLLKIIDYREYGYLGLRENTYLITLLMLIIFFVGYLYKQHLKPWLIHSNSLTKYITSTIEYAFLIIFVFIFLRPINQFIYFQF